MPQSVTSLRCAKDRRCGLLQLRIAFRLQEPSLFEHYAGCTPIPMLDSINALILHGASPGKKWFLPRIFVETCMLPSCPEWYDISLSLTGVACCWTVMVTLCFSFVSQRVDFDPGTSSVCSQLSHFARILLTCEGSTGITTLLASSPRYHPDFLTSTLAARTANTRHLLECQYQLWTSSSSI